MMIRRLLEMSVVALMILWLAAAPAHAADTATLAHIKLAGSLGEAPVSDDPLFGVGAENFRTKLERIKKAKEDTKIEGLYLELAGLQIGRGKLYELRRVIADFRKSGKKAFAFLESATAGDYLVAAACDEICMPESGWLVLTGVRAEMSFYKDLLDKVGVKADMLQMGAFKGAAEPLTRSSMSPQLKKHMEGLVDDFFDYDLVATIVESRKGVTAEKVKKFVDEGPYSAKGAKEAGLIDRIDYDHPFRASLKDAFKANKIRVSKNYGKDKAEELDLSNPFALFKLLAPPKLKKSLKPKVAVIYATGVIVSGRGGESPLGEDACGAITMIEAIRQANDDDTVKAIVLRVDSPGGSALASDLIWNELVKSKKPVIASMGDVAASGGYYISMPAQKIYAEPGTITGSIGVVGGKIVLGGLYDRIGLHTEVIARGANSGMFSSTQPFSDSERKAITGLMRETYDQFLDKAIAGRGKAGTKLTRDDMTKLAEGRVWTGRQAKKHGLVDELGTLDDAIAEARKLGKLRKDEGELLILPRAKTFIEQFIDRTDTKAPAISVSRLPIVRELPGLADHVRTMDGLLRLRGEPVWVLMPFELRVR